LAEISLTQAAGHALVAGRIRVAGSNINQYTKTPLVHTTTGHALVSAFDRRHQLPLRSPGTGTSACWASVDGNAEGPFDPVPVRSCNSPSAFGHSSTLWLEGLAPASFILQVYTTQPMSLGPGRAGSSPEKCRASPRRTAGLSGLTPGCVFNDTTREQGVMTAAQNTGAESQCGQPPATMAEPPQAAYPT